jgi:RimJ/RimL family protein N-acetyltransferase
MQFVHLSEVKEEDIIELMNNELVAEHMPLLVAGFSPETCRAFLRAKQQLWDDHGFGPWAFLINGEFAGWGGLQPEQGEADFALVLHPRFWGWGRRIFEKVRDLAFEEMNLDSITVLFPPARKNSKTITRFGFVEDGQLTIDGKLFKRFRLAKQPR